MNQNKKLINAELDEKNTMPYVGAAPEAHLVPTPLQWTELPLTRLNCSGPPSNQALNTSRNGTSMDTLGKCISESS